MQRARSHVPPAVNPRGAQDGHDAFPRHPQTSHGMDLAAIVHCDLTAVSGGPVRPAREHLSMD